MMDQQTPVAKEAEAKEVIAAPHELSRQTSTMRKWLRLTARKQSKVKQKQTVVDTGNDAAQAAADAIAQMLGDARRHG